ncbi:histone-lysine N-methyltransferase, H3 lysine-79 specific-like [Dendronephthya gigantea]|uniref:histone-lysine N-methyltransferase, H3 lysine-79 specific-like n=1 Tax=Dendronephthya gigantea TaxID=151771 RepID=UPI00106CC351|nr:histone-lysine N-methyltransferase, H3 lysine-79 specific-like [Dendronephthya gigantea]XP_028390590.1 histone-lysine N-methyltransferase, H3 lysine-79 specific-like [Dendronephthya gigantea]
MISEGKPLETEVGVQGQIGQINSPMEWTRKHDIVLFREVLAVNPYQAKKKTVQRGQFWQTVAGNLVQLEDPSFKKTLSKRSVQDRCTLLCEKHKKRIAYEMKATGISPQLTELDSLIEETLEKEEASEELRASQSEVQKKKVEEDQKNAVDIRKKAMEKFGETKKRKIDEGEIEEKKRRRRRSGSDTLQFIREQSENEMKIRERELELEKEKQNREQEKHNEFKEMMAQQMAQQQQQMAQFQMMFMQQNNLMLSILEKKSS